MRVTESGRFHMLESELRRANSDISGVTERLTTGRAINRLSDDPELAVQADRLLAEDRELQAYADAADNARAWLSTQDGALQSSVNIMSRVRELTISAGSPLGPSAREGIALELDGLRAQLIDLANTSFSGRSVFGGFADSTVAEVAGVVQLVGDSGTVQRRVNETNVVQINISGGEAFGFDAGDDIFGIIADIAADVRAGSTAATSTTGLSRLHTASSRLTESLGSVGAKANQVSSALDAGTARRDEVGRYRSSIVDADIAKTALELGLAQTAYEAVLAATARLQLPTLGDYLR